MVAFTVENYRQRYKKRPDKRFTIATLQLTFFPGDLLDII